MKVHEVCVYPSSRPLPAEEQLAWKLAAMATDATLLDEDVLAMIGNRIIDNAAVAMAAIDRAPVQTARAQALAHPRPGGATVLGISAQRRFCAEWAAWANSTAVRELDMHDTFLAADYAHPADNIPPLLAVGQQLKKSGVDLARGIAAAYEAHVSLVEGICLHAQRVDHVAHLGPAVAAGLGAMLMLPTEVVYQAIGQTAHLSFATRQSRKGAISSWKAFAPAHVGKLAIEAVDRAIRGQRSPTPIYEGEDSLIAAFLAGPEAVYQVALPEPGEPKRAIMKTYTKQHAAEYQAQAFIDLACELRGRIADREAIERVVLYTSQHTHRVIGTGSGDPQKYDPQASRETLDHSVAYIFAVALEDGEWHHERSYAPSRAGREATRRLWQKIVTTEDAVWSRRYHAKDPAARAFGGRAEVTLQDGSKVVADKAVANAHPLGAQPMSPEDYRDKLATLSAGIVAIPEVERFVMAVDHLRNVEDLSQLNLETAAPITGAKAPKANGIF